jgi:hypothetical protein
MAAGVYNLGEEGRYLPLPQTLDVAAQQRKSLRSDPHPALCRRPRVLKFPGGLKGFLIGDLDGSAVSSISTKHQFIYAREESSIDLFVACAS